MTIVKTMVMALVVLTTSTTRAQLPPGFDAYLIGFLTRTTGRLPAGSGFDALQKAHLANLNAMRQDGLLLASGPFADNGDLQGLLIFRGDRRDIVEQRVADDPLVKAGFMTIALGPWLGPAGIGDE